MRFLESVLAVFLRVGGLKERIDKTYNREEVFNQGTGPNTSTNHKSTLRELANEMKEAKGLSILQPMGTRIFATSG